MIEVSIIAAFVAGIFSFLSPCVLPLIPGFLAYLSGTSIKGAEHERWRIFLHSVFYVLGFALVFAVLGVLLNTVLESVSYDVQVWLARLGGLIIILFGLSITKLIRIPFLEQEHSIEVKRRFSNSYIMSFVFGAAFAVGWSPCVGAVLGSVLALAISQPGMGFALLLTYSLGLGLPFLIVGYFSVEVLRWIKKLGSFLKYFNWIVGALLIIIGLLVFTQSLNIVANFFAVNPL